jgi:hypothetical protein
MELMGQTVEYRRLIAPRTDGAALVEPPVAMTGELLARNAGLVAAADCNIQGRCLSELARAARAELLQAAQRYTAQYRDVAQFGADPAAPLLLAGHQPQLFHPGVWYKNFLLSALAARHAGTAVNLVIDSDTIKTAALRVPGGSTLEPRVEAVPLDHASAEIPYEERGVLDPCLLRSFATRARAVLGSLVTQPLLEEFWPLVVERAAAGATLGECLSQARHLQEGRWGATTLELPQSRVCELETFAWFTCHLLAELPRVHAAYNVAVAEYRRANHIRSQAHPVPDLATDGDWLEAPYWVWSRDNPRRRRLFARRIGREIELTDRSGLGVRLALAPGQDAGRAVEQLAAWRQAGVKLRTRALGTTLFARLVVGDLFVHGIGGAKYDQVTDRLISRLFRIEPPTYLTATATLRLPVTRRPVTWEDRQLADARLRELEFHPERHLDHTLDDANVAELVARKQKWIATPQTIENARTRCQEIRSVNTALQGEVAPLREELLVERDRLNTALRGEAILQSREYAFPLFPAQSLRKLMESTGEISES